MKIAAVEVFGAVNDLAGRVWNPKIRWLQKHSVLVRVRTDQGVSGFGECWCFDRRPDALAAFLVHEVAPRILGCDAAAPEGIAELLGDTTTLSARHGIMASAVSGIDIALWDIAGKARELPLWRLLGGERPEVAVYASGGLYGVDKPPERLAAELAGYRDQGFDQVKMKIGALSPAEDEARVRAARRALGDRPRLIVDGVYSYDTASAVEIFDRIAGCDIAAFQSPLPADDIGGMAALVGRGVPVMGLEAEYRPLVIEALLARSAVAILQFALVACGGVTAARKIVSQAQSAGIPCSLEVSSTALAQMAAFHFAAAHPQVASVEYHMVHQALFEALPFPADAIRDGRLILSERPGLGIDLPIDRLDRLG